MSKSLVTETPDVLFKKAENDILSVDILISTPKYPIDRMYDVICFHATQAVEKLLKGYIILNKKTVEKIHNLDVLHKIAMEIDNSFLGIMDYCLQLNEYVPNVKYSNENLITKQNMNDIIKSMQAICNFPQIKTIRESFSNKYNYQIVTEIVLEPQNTNI